MEKYEIEYQDMSMFLAFGSFGQSGFWHKLKIDELSIE